MSNYKCNEKVKGVITGITKYGIFVKIDDEYTGLVHISEISDKYIDDIKKIYVIGESVEAKIVDIDDEKKQLKLSSKEINSKSKLEKTLKEDGRGFEPLKEKLDFWIEKKLKDIEKNKQILKLREELNNSIINGEEYEKIYKLSVELDELITEYYREKLEK